MSKARGTNFFFRCFYYFALHYCDDGVFKVGAECGGKRESVITAAQLCIEQVEAIKAYRRPRMLLGLHDQSFLLLTSLEKTTVSVAETPSVFCCTQICLALLGPSTLDKAGISIPRRQFVMTSMTQLA